MPIPKPLALSDRQLEIVFTAAEPLFFDDRPAFLREVAAALGSPFRLSDDSVARVCTAGQSRYPAAPPRASCRALRCALARTGSRSLISRLLRSRMLERLLSQAALGASDQPVQASPVDRDTDHHLAGSPAFL
jgi:hypothetical protein